jgi:hypothetical protein
MVSSNLTVGRRSVSGVLWKRKTVRHLDRRDTDWLSKKTGSPQLGLKDCRGSKMTNDKGQYLCYSKVDGVIVTGNEVGAKHAFVLHSLRPIHIGFTIPSNVDTYWVRPGCSLY